jgi:serine/threonine-protein kinase
MQAPGAPGYEAGAERDALLAELLADLLESARTGEIPDVERVARAHPDLAVELRELWGTARLADDFGSFSEEVTLVPGLKQRPVTAWTDEISTRTIGDYDILEKLGSGGMGVVYKARQQSLGRIVALKMLLQGENASPVDMARFRAEAESAAHLDHPRITRVYEVGEFEGQPYFSMQYVAGTTLSKRLAEGPLPPREAAAILAPVCRAIAEAHQRGVLHRDLKPSNILLDREGLPHVTDFGLAKRLHPALADGTAAAALTLSGAILGTPSYMAPEQAAGQRGVLSPASDVYSLGAILYHMLTGRPPFQAASPVDTVLMVLEQDPLPPRLLNPKADRDLEMIALKCLQKPTELRYASAAALADDLEAYLANEPISARSTRFTQIVSRMLRETHHAGVLENWGLLWMWHSLVLLVLCLLTNGFHLWGVTSTLGYLALWGLGLGAWAVIFWALRRRSGPITFVERQIAHVWAGSMVCSTMLYVVEMLLHLPVLTLSPVLALTSGMVFLVKAGILSGAFYFQAAALFATAAVMAAWPTYGLTVFGVVSGLCFFIPGLKYYRQRERIMPVDGRPVGALVKTI